MRKLIRRRLPTHASIRTKRWLRPFGGRLQHPNLWHLNRHSVAGGVAVGLFAGLIPGPLQMISAALLATTLRVNLPVAMFTTLYTNPLTIIPLYLLAYEYGALLTGHSAAAVNLLVPELHWDSWLTVLLDWLISLGQPFLVGLPMLALTLSAAGYGLTRLAWRAHVQYDWYRRGLKRRRALQNP